MSQFVDTAFRYIYLFAAFIVGYSSHTVGYLQQFGVFLLQFYNLPDILKIDGIPQSVHHAPCLIEFLLVHLVLFQVFRYLVQAGFQFLFQKVFLGIQIFLFLFLQLLLKRIFPVFQHLLPNGGIMLLVFVPEHMFVEWFIEGILFIVIFDFPQ